MPRRSPRSGPCCKTGRRGRRTATPSCSRVWRLDEPDEETLTCAGLLARSRAVAAALQARCRPRDRALILCPPGLGLHRRVLRLPACRRRGRACVSAPQRRAHGPAPHHHRRRRRLRHPHPRHLAGEAVCAAIRQAVARDHEVEPHAVVLIRPASLPRTSSGKIERTRARTLFLSEGLAEVGPLATRGSRSGASITAV